MRTELHREEVKRLMHTSPFRPFVLTLESGQTLVIEHPENVAFDPTVGGRSDLYVLGAKLRCYTTFDAIAMIATLDSLLHTAGSEGA